MSEDNVKTVATQNDNNKILILQVKEAWKIKKPVCMTSM